MRKSLVLILILVAISIAWIGRAPEDPTLYPQFDRSAVDPPPQKPAVAQSAERSVFFGDLHIHTSLSMDAYLFGVRAGPEDAYTFAKGGTIEHGAGYAIRLSEPLDFAAVTDHAEFLGMLEGQGVELPLSGGALRKTLLARNRFSATLLFASTMRHFVRPDEAGAGDPEIMRPAWQRIMTAAEQANDPGVFTAFVGYEWTGMVGPANLHRNVIYRGNKAPFLPFSADDSVDPEDLWRVLEDQSREGIEAIAIPHNANVSDGLMFANETLGGDPLTADYAARRTRWEPIQEIFQVKGASETHPVLSGDDEFAAFEIKESMLSTSGAKSNPKGSYARDGLRRGLEYRVSEGFDPFDFGVIGSSDGHGASAPIEEDRFHGKLPLLDGTAGIRLGTASFIPPNASGVDEWGSGGLAAVWAEGNTRESLFDAMRRREVYATSGPRIRVRFFAGWDYPETLFEQPNGIRQAYTNGVPMGSVLTPRAAAVPTIAVWALKDPRGANLDRIQIVKLGVDSSGASFEKIFDVVASGGRVPASSWGRVDAVWYTVDAGAASYSNTIGTAELNVVWRDPEFEPGLPCRYYARVLEIPTPRWTTYDARALGIEAPMPSSIQERAVTSTITYLPKPENSGAMGSPASG
jgi:hypothetical protein